MRNIFKLKNIQCIPLQVLYYFLHSPLKFSMQRGKNKDVYPDGGWQMSNKLIEREKEKRKGKWTCEQFL